MATMNPSSPQPPARSALVISAFLAEYSANWEFYNEASRVAKEICEKGLKACAIPLGGQPESRGKDPASLEKKLYKRQKTYEYQTKEDIRADIVDLCGARITLAYATDEDAVKDIIYDKFNVIGEKLHKADGSSIYHATHYHVNLKTQDSIQYHLGDAKTSIIEIQVRSFIANQIAVLEHPFYKSGPGSNTKRIHNFTTMSTLRGLYEGCVEQEQINRAEQTAKDKRAFYSLNELGKFIEKWIDKEAAPWVKKELIGESCKAFLFLLKLNSFKSMNCQKKVREHLQSSLSEQSVYERISNLYDPYEFTSLTVIGYLVDRIILTDDGKPKVPLPTYNGLGKIEVIMSTIRWLNKLFDPSLTWTCLFYASREREVLFGGLEWLLSSGRLVENNEQLDERDIVRLNALWGWFDAHDARKIQLTFTMSRIGIQRKDGNIDVIERLVKVNELAWWP